MFGKVGAHPVIVPAVVAVMALSLVAVPVLLPDSSDPGPADSRAAEMSDDASDQVAPGDDGVEEPAPASPPPQESSMTVEETETRTLLDASLNAYEEQLQLAGGVRGSFISASSQEMLISLQPNGDYRAVTTDPNAPEWLYVNPSLYARLGEPELAAQREALDAIGKPEAIWTDAATISQQQGVHLSAANIANAVADLSPLMQDVYASEGPDGVTVLQGTIDLAGDLGFNAEAYNLQSVTDPSAEPALRLASVAFTIDKNGVLQGYIVQPPRGAQPVSLLLTKFVATTVKRPSPGRIVTIEDLAPVLADTPSPSASP